MRRREMWGEPPLRWSPLNVLDYQPHISRRFPVRTFVRWIHRFRKKIYHRKTILEVSSLLTQRHLRTSETYYETLKTFASIPRFISKGANERSDQLSPYIYCLSEPRWVRQKFYGDYLESSLLCSKWATYLTESAVELSVPYPLSSNYRVKIGPDKVRRDYSKRNCQCWSLYEPIATGELSPAIPDFEEIQVLQT